MSENEMELEMLFVGPDSIGCGHGKRLLDHAKRTAQESGFESILVQGDPHADGFYRSQGGQLVGERPSESIPGRLLPLYRLSL